MTHLDALQAYLRRHAYEQHEILADFAYQLTMIARDSYEVGGEGITDPKRFRSVNELLHRVTSQIITRLRRGPLYQTQEYLLSMIYDCDDDTLRDQVINAFETAVVAS